MTETTTINGDSTNSEIMLPESELEDGVVEQIREMIDHEAFQNKVVVMPDTHVGSGAVIGFTMSLGERVVPNSVGTDVGCGMYAANFGSVEYNEETLKQWDEEIRNAVPMGFNVYEDTDYHLINDFPWEKAHKKVGNFEEQYGGMKSDVWRLEPEFASDYFSDLCEHIGYNQGRAINSIGTLGGGNHFIELGHSDKTGLWCIIHSGSRGLGLNVAQHHQDRAESLRSAETFRLEVLPESYRDYATEQLKPKANKIREDFEGKEIGQVFDIISQARQEATENFNGELAYLEGGEAHQYFVDMIFAQMYASQSRKLMMSKVAEVVGATPKTRIESVHNFIDFEDLTIRKGATSAHSGETAVVPFNMRDGTLLVRGKGNDDWNNSSPHGAGRVMSRSQAYDNLDVDSFEEEMSDVVSSTVNQETLDEAPAAYKSTALIEEMIDPTAEVVDRIEPVLNIKAE